MGFKQFFNKAYSALGAAGRAKKAELRPIFRDFYDSGITDVEKAVAKYNETKVAINAAVDAASNGTERVVSIKPIGKKVVNSGEKTAEQTTESVVEKTTLKPPGAPNPNARNIGKELLADSEKDAEIAARQDAYWKDQEARIAQIKANVKANQEAEKLESANITNSNTSYTGNIKWDAKILSANELEMQATEAALENSGKITSTEIQKEQMKRWSVTPGGGMKIETNKPFVPSKTYNVGTPESANGLINTGDEFNIPVVATDGFSPEMLKTDRYSGIATHPRTYSNKYTYENIDRNGYIKPALSKEQMKLQYGSQPVNEDAPWASGMKIALGTAVTGAALCAALSSSRGQQNNAQLYGQQPLY